MCSTVVFDTLTERGENVDELITTKMDQSEGITYGEASREVVAEAMTDILPDANFVEELATNHKTVFNKLHEKLKEFVSELKAYFNSLLSNRSREANALKEQVGESVKYVENIVKLFDKVAVEAVENYQATVATETETENNDGGIENAEQQPEQRTDNEGRTDKTSAGSNEKALSKAGDRRGISEEVGRDRQNLEQDLHLRGGQRGITQTRFSEDSFINPKIGSVEAEEYAKLSEYGIEGYVVKKSAWDRNVQAFSRDGRIYMREGMDEIYRGTVVSHEATQVMKQLQYQPYLDFLDRTPVMLDMASVYAQSLLNGPAEHYNIDISADEKQLSRIYDEINATIYGSYVAGQIVGEIKDKVKNAFYNFDAYINELAGIHDQFKKENAPKEEVKTQGKQTEVSGDSFIITDNAEYGTLEIKFDGKPSEAVRDVLKAHKFRWHRTKGVWYGKSERADIVRALQEVYQQEQSITDAFREKVIKKFAESYKKGLTPNPCIDCNRYIKFAKLYERAKILGCDCIATGHYARIEKQNGKYILKKALDETKDQSYVLYSMTQDQLAHTVFPVGEMKKAEVRELAKQSGFVNANKPDSQDICFAPDGDYSRVIELWDGGNTLTGNFIDKHGNVIGKHRGVIHYTVGQRKGLGISNREPLYVCGINAANGDIVLGGNDDLFGTESDAAGFNWISGAPPEGEFRCKVKTRYRQAEQWATVIPTGNDSVHIVFDLPQRAVTPGQAAVLYDGDTVIGGGTIQ